MDVDTPLDQADLHLDALPPIVSTGATVLVARAGDPTAYASTLRILCMNSQRGDTAYVVTTTESSTDTVATYDAICSTSDRSAIAIVDTTSEQQSVSAPYGDTQVVHTPSPADLERLILALSELTDESPPTENARHLVVRSLTPLLKHTSAGQVHTVLERIIELSTDDGIGLLGIDYTAHSASTIKALAGLVDGILWMTREGDCLHCEYRPK